MAAPSKAIKIGKYDVVDTIGRGGMGVVYLAKDPYLDRLVAIKMMNVDVHENSDFLERFYREAKGTASLRHPNIVTVFDLGEHQSRPFLVMEYLEGNSLEVLLRAHHPMSLLEKINIIMEVCQGLSYAHQRGIIHRDIKPGNIMVLNDGSVKIVDFGIARLGDHGMTRTGQMVGSLYYMSPEQFREKGVDFRTDIYATGVVLYQLLTYALPFEGESTAATLAKIISDDPAPFRQFGVSCPSELEAVTLKALAKNRDQRYPSADAFAGALAEIQDRLKRETVADYLNKAELLQQSNELVQAQECLVKVLKLDRQNTTAGKLLSAVRAKLQVQVSAKRIGQLTKQAEEAYGRKDFDASLTFVGEALGLSASPELQSLKASIEKAKAEAELVAKAIAQAEAAQRSGDLERAQSAIEDAFSHRPEDSKIKVLRRAIARDLEERERQKKLEGLLDEVRKQMTARKFTSALDLLREAQRLDPSAPQLRPLLDKLAGEHQREKHRRRIEELNREVQQAIDRDDYEGASAKASEALQEFPNELNLAQLKELADAQIAIAAQKEFVRGQIAAAEQLLDDGQTQRALVLVESALQRAGGNSRLESFRTMLQERLAKDLAEADKATCMQQANDAVGLGRYADAIRILETAQVRFVESSGLDELLRFARDQKSKQEQQEYIDEATKNAQRLLADQHFEEAVQVLEKAVERVPSEDLKVLLRQARNQLESFRRDLQGAIDKGNALLAEGAAVSATEFLGSRPASYQQFTAFRDLQSRARSVALASAEAAAPKAAATQMFAGGKGEPGNASEPAEDARATRRFATGSSTKPSYGSSQAILEEPAPPPPITGPGEGPPQSHRLWVLGGAIAFAVILGVGLLGWWLTKPTYLVVQGPQGAEVTIDGVAVAKVESGSEASIKVSPGKHAVQVTAPGDQPWSQKVTVQRGARQTVVATLQPLPPPPPPPQTWPVELSSNVEGAAVYVDNSHEASFETKKLTIRLTEGPHVIVLKKQGYDDTAEKTVEVSANLSKGKPIPFDLQKSKEAIPQPTDADLTVKARPGASVIVNDEAWPVDSRGNASKKKLAPGSYYVRVNAEGYLPWEKTIKLQAGSSPVLPVEFKPQPPKFQPPPPPPPPAPAATISTFEASPRTVQAGGEAKLKWTTQHADGAFISGIGKLDPSGEKKVNPTRTTDYTLTATGPGGSAEPQTVTITVEAEPPPPPPPAKKNASANETTGSSSGTNAADIEGIRSVIEQYKEAYQSMTLDAFKTFWPTIPRKKLDIIKDEFDKAKAVVVKDDCPGDPTISRDQATWTCRETKSETADRQRQTHPPRNVEFTFVKRNGKWTIDSQTVQ